jgi:hypothetical protein
MKNFISAVILLFCCMTNINAQTVPSYVSTTGLVGWWPFNGNANDESVNGNNGFVNGPILTTDRFGNSNKAYSFDGVNDNINPLQNNLPFGTTARTISVWFQRIGTGGCLFSYGSANTSNAYMISIGANIISNQGWADDFPVYPSIDNSWHNLVCTFDGLNSTIYLDNSNLGSNSMTSWNTIAGSFYFGTRVLNDMDFFNGKIDDIAIWNRALSNCEVQQLYMASLTTFTVNAISSSSIICSGQTTTLTASGASSYTWQPMSVVNSTNSVTPLTTSLYTVVATNTAGCTSTKTISILVNPTPTITVNSGTICTGQSFTISPSGASTYTYSSGSSVVSPTLTTTYSVTGTNTLGCNSTSPALSNVFVSLCTSIDELDNNQSIIFYPNPFTNEIYLKMEGDIKNKKYFIYNTSGQVIQTGILNGNKINCTDFSKGLYLIKLEGSTKTFKLVKEN